MMKTATAFLGDICYACANQAYERCFICNHTACPLHSSGASFNVSQRATGMRIYVDDRSICDDCLERLLGIKFGMSDSSRATEKKTERATESETEHA